LTSQPQETRVDLYFSCSLTGGRGDQPIYAAIVDHLLAQGHTVPTAALAHPGVMSEEAVIDAAVVYQRDIQWLEAADGVIAEVSTPSHGVGYEIAWALLAGKPVLCLHRQDARVSKMILGNGHPGLTVRAYGDTAAALEMVEAFLRDSHG
jgi:hypothetical protein